MSLVAALEFAVTRSLIADVDDYSFKFGRRSRVSWSEIRSESQARWLATISLVTARRFPAWLLEGFGLLVQSRIYPASMTVQTTVAVLPPKFSVAKRRAPSTW